MELPTWLERDACIQKRRYFAARKGNSSVSTAFAVDMADELPKSLQQLYARLDILEGRAVVPGASSRTSISRCSTTASSTRGTRWTSGAAAASRSEAAPVASRNSITSIAGVSVEYPNTDTDAAFVHPPGHGRASARPMSVTELRRCMSELEAEPEALPDTSPATEPPSRHSSRVTVVASASAGHAHSDSHGVGATDNALPSAKLSAPRARSTTRDRKSVV